VAVVVVAGGVDVGLDRLDLGPHVVGDVAVAQGQGVDALAAPGDPRLAVVEPGGQGVEGPGGRVHHRLGVVDVRRLGVLVDLGAEGVEAGAAPRGAVGDLAELVAGRPGGVELAGDRAQVAGAAPQGDGRAL
jgi:hypothetical protein